MQITQVIHKNAVPTTVQTLPIISKQECQSDY